MFRFLVVNLSFTSASKTVNCCRFYGLYFSPCLFSGAVRGGCPAGRLPVASWSARPPPRPPCSTEWQALDVPPTERHGRVTSHGGCRKEPWPAIPYHRRKDRPSDRRLSVLASPSSCRRLLVMPAQAGIHAFPGLQRRKSWMAAQVIRVVDNVGLYNRPMHRPHRQCRAGPCAAEHMLDSSDRAHG